MNVGLLHHVAGPESQVPHSQSHGRHKHHSRKSEKAISIPSFPRDKDGDTGAGHNVSVEELDWLELLECPPASRETRFRLAYTETGPDVILAADCVYNPALIPAFVCALSHYAQPGRTVAVVAVELRASDVLQEFLAAWIADGCWEIWRLEGDGDDGWLGPDFAVWVGWKVAKDE